MSLLDKIHKKIDKDKNEELKKLNEETNDKFVQFQLENNVRAQILNPYADNVIVAMVMEHSVLGWRPMENEEKQSIQAKLAKKAGIDLQK